VTAARQASDGVGPVLQPTPLARAVVAAMEEENDGVVVHDEGAYLRVLGPRVCRVSRSGVEARTGVPVRFPGDLEVIMSSFAGLVAMNEDGAVWWLASEPRPDPPSDHD
jgi:toluene monooxygenase system protein D